MNEAGYSYDSDYFEQLHEWTRKSFPVIKRLCQENHPKMVKHCLDIGCGQGIYFDVLKEFCDDVFGLDQSKYLLSETAEKGYIALTMGDAKNLPFKEASFDYVFTTEVIEHVKEYDEFLLQIFRVLTPAGQLFLTTTTYSRYGYRLFQKAVKDIYLLKIDIKRFLRSLRNYIKGFRNLLCYEKFIMEEIFEPLGGHYHGFFAHKLSAKLSEIGFSSVKYGYFRVDPPIKLLNGGQIRKNVSLMKKIFFTPFAVIIRTANYLIVKLGGFKSNIYISAEK